EEDVVLQALQAYYGIILAEELSETAREAVEVAETNLKQVEAFYNEGTATQLDLQRARAQYYSTLPQFESAESNRLLSYQNLVLFIDFELEDSIVAVDTLSSIDFLMQLKDVSLADYKNISFANRRELKAVNYQFKVTDESESIA